MYPEVVDTDQLIDTSLKKFILKFKERTMIIYDYIISERKVK